MLKHSRILFLSLTLSGILNAREPEGKPTIQAVRLTRAIKVDGKLDEPFWQTAPPIDSLYQYEPRAGDELTEDTEVRFVYDDKAIYMGVSCLDRNPDGIIARGMERDGFISPDDYVYFMMDTFHDQRNGYVFSVNPNGARYDALLSRGTSTNSEWDGVWQVKTSIDDEGWKAEIAIPFNSLSFDPNNDTWGFNISRNIRRKSERGRWTGARPEIRTSYAAEAGDLTGLEDLKQGLGIEFSPYVVGRYHRGGGDTDYLGDAGADFRYRITPNISATLSYNTDFAETEVDDRQINLTRFPLFFPEKRGFFLEDSGIYNFGGLTSSRRSRTGLRNLLVPYFTRRIGLSDDGDILPITLAGKVAGRVGDYEIGLTHARLQGRHGLGNQQVTSGRIVRHFGEQSSLGVLATAGNPNSDGDNVLLGADYRFRTSDFLGDKFLQSDIFALGTSNDDPDLGNQSDYAYGFSLSYPNEPLYLSLKYMEIGEDFNPALGFVRRQGVRAYATTSSYTLRQGDSSWLREYRIGLDTEHFTSLDNLLDSAEYTFTPLEIKFTSADEFEIKIEHSIDRPTEDFEIADGVIISAGNYAWTDISATFTSAQKRMIGVEMGVALGDFYDGNRQRAFIELNILPNKHLSLDLDYGINRIDLPNAQFDTHLASARMVWKFTPDLTWSHLVQYDSISDSMGFQSLLRWEYLPGSELFAVVNQSYLHEYRTWKTVDEELAVKVGANVRF
ncbi:MAG: hypothetical protein ACI8T1_001553 [Verrucomicrobiales bacterium]|jgi:hypothetical protein